MTIKLCKNALFEQRLQDTCTLFFTVINCKIPLCSFNNTFNSRLTFVEPPTYPHPDLTPDWTPPPRPRLFLISSIRSSHTPDPHPIAPSTFQFHNSFNSWITTTRPHPRPDPRPDTPPHIQKRIFIRGICLEGPIVFNTMI